MKTNVFLTVGAIIIRILYLNIVTAMLEMVM
jgi:hypothetical protein